MLCGGLFPLIREEVTDEQLLGRKCAGSEGSLSLALLSIMRCLTDRTRRIESSFADLLVVRWRVRVSQTRNRATAKAAAECVISGELPWVLYSEHRGQPPNQIYIYVRHFNIACVGYDHTVCNIVCRLWPIRKVNPFVSADDR